MIKIETILKQDKLDKSITEQVILYKGESYTFFDSGLTRYCFVNKDKTKVIKLLIEQSAYRHDFNEEEFKIYKNASKEKKKELAETKLSNGFIEQEFCNPIKFDDRKLTIKQLLFAKSCRNEVGWTKDGRLVCFDLDEYKKY